MLVCRIQMASPQSQDSQNTCVWEQHNCELGKGGSKNVNWALQQFFEKCFYQHLLLFSRKPECVIICHWGHPLGSRAAKSCVCAEENKQAERRGKRKGAGTETPQVCPQRAAVSEGQLQCCISCSLLALPGALGLRGTRTAVHNGLSEKGSNACHSKWGFDSFVLFFAPVWRAAPTRGSLPRHFGSKVLVTLIFISLGPFELHCPSSKV